ncbi:glycosyltransferase family 2 protein [Streptomyces sp. SID10853]|uniref:glycosyltransferase family 2 protein n=1 Tax=Streptomyces sp. SID10853 TaxID=2706028 RepID=UPI0013BEBAE1|nr:glycosyltransferase family 2 protein [Streptomyces sp. SID10853]NDZ79694.1 glycosyltransferase family 2 protein [Streptomyces sp. SID10853]
MVRPTVSVIVAAYNAMPYVTRSISSVAEQTTGRDVLEVIAVDDGSTDGTGEELERLSRLYPGLVRVLHQENSGGPSAPRNVGLDHARGEFLFFLDADDYLGPEALERMVAMARQNGTDIVLGKMVGVGGRRLPMSMFQRNQPKTDVFNSRVYWALNPLKLFRRELLERHGLRFPTGLPIGEDQPFTALAYLHASGISVVADYDCLFCTLRDDGGNTTVRTTGAEPRLRFLPYMIDLLLTNVPPGPGRDHLAHRHLTVEVQNLLSHLLLEPRVQQEKTLARLAEIVTTIWHEGMNGLSAMARLRLHLVRHEMLDEVVELVRFERELARTKVSTPVHLENGRAYACYPFFRDPAHPVPDACYDVTSQLGVRHHVTRAELRGTTLHLAGHGYLHRVETRDVTTELVLRERESRTEYRLPVRHTGTPQLGTDEDQGRYAYDLAGYEAEVGLATAADGQPLADGLWDICLVIGAQGVTREVRIGSRRADDVSGLPTTRIVTGAGDGPRAVTLHTTKPYGNFTLDIGERKHRVATHVAIGAPRWSAGDPTELAIGGTSSLAEYPDVSLAVVLTACTGAVVVRPALRTPGTDDFTARVNVRNLSAGVWTGELRLGDGGEWTVPLPALPKNLSPAKWRHLGLPWYAKPASGSGRRFALRVARAEFVKAVVRRVKP